MNTTASAQIVGCPNCGDKNRIDPARAADAVCGKCKSPLSSAGKPIQITDSNFASEVEQSALPSSSISGPAGAVPAG